MKKLLLSTLCILSVFSATKAADDKAVKAIEQALDDIAQLQAKLVKSLDEINTEAAKAKEETKPAEPESKKTEAEGKKKPKAKPEKEAAAEQPAEPATEQPAKAEAEKPAEPAKVAVEVAVEQPAEQPAETEAEKPAAE